ncbi:molybdenum ABC transporter ATP-binding protein [Paracoccus xiamenensis]|uniref:molybdenum ABC transporter ATP-binding protein n=1 Tax=Paracoccus xiamenensis TaxID=2714901 RepID=UPI00140B3FDF|nr:molybdenum ABC transporter ATP-binding protein [Paracoccus xiamenensis]NHF72277.1 molybdenum ABC transporter ATP-binding protein [Paracoccus xiamenensis]
MSLSVQIKHDFPGFALDVDFTAGPGVTALFGRSGAGKTTVVNAVAGLLRPDHARITFGDEVLTDTQRGIFLPPHKRRVGYVFQDARLFPHLSVRGNLDYGRRLAPRTARPDDARVTEIVDLLGIGALLDRRPGALSGGEKQRVALGRAILSGPRLLLMDEPLAALDDARKAEILPYLENLRDNLGLPILYVSHAMPEITRLASTVIMLDGGRVMTAGPTEAVLSDPASSTALGRETGALLTASVAAQDVDGLARLDTQAGPVWVARPDLAIGTKVRLRILAQDVMLATEAPRNISALNVLTGRIDRIENAPDGSVLVRLHLGDGTAILSRITSRSRDALQLEIGASVHAVLKSVSIAEVAAN